jgi:hypothetical protein
MKVYWPLPLPPGDPAPPVVPPPKPAPPLDPVEVVPGPVGVVAGGCVLVLGPVGGLGWVCVGVVSVFVFVGVVLVFVGVVGWVFVGVERVGVAWRQWLATSSVVVLTPCERFFLSVRLTDFGSAATCVPTVATALAASAHWPA